MAASGLRLTSRLGSEHQAASSLAIQSQPLNLQAKEGTGSRGDTAKRAVCACVPFAVFAKQACNQGSCTHTSHRTVDGSAEPGLLGQAQAAQTRLLPRRQPAARARAPASGRAAIGWFVHTKAARADLSIWRCRLNRRLRCMAVTQRRVVTHRWTQSVLQCVLHCEPC